MAHFVLHARHVGAIAEDGVIGHGPLGGSALRVPVELDLWRGSAGIDGGNADVPIVYQRAQ